jgi:rhamnulokinase
MPTYAAVDLGATSGRVVNVHIDRDHISLDVVRRFANELVIDHEGMATWNVDRLLTEIETGLAEAALRAQLTSVGVDSWAVDYGFLDAAGQRLGPVHAYRSRRTDGVMDAVCERIGREPIYAATGIQFLPFNTFYQLVAAKPTAEYHEASEMLMVPDLVNHALCGSRTNDVTNASTTQLLDARTHTWNNELIGALNLRRDLMPTLHQPGTHLGTTSSGLQVVAVASHDTASAVAGTPLSPNRPAIYISCGTWALVGCELRAPITDEKALDANVTNELGFNGTTRLLKNVTGFWLLEECRRAWAANGVHCASVAELMTAAALLPGGQSLFDPDDPRLVGATDMPVSIRKICSAAGQIEPGTPAEVTRAILDALALSFRRTVRVIEDVTGIRAEVLHLIGGGAHSRLLARLTASACDRTVLAGPAEATVIGNALVQAIADGTLADLNEGRRLIERSLPPLVFTPERCYDWEALERRVGVAPRGQSSIIDTGRRPALATAPPTRKDAMEPEELRLYRGTAPGSEQWTQQVTETFSAAWQTRVISNVVDPTLTVYRPDPARSNGSAVVICPGGGFHALSIDSEGVDVARRLVASGMTAVVLKYRLVACSSADPGAKMMAKSRPEMDQATAPVVPLAMADGLAAMTYVRAHANDYGLDPERVGILGFSAGGTVAASVAYNYDPNSRPAFLGAIYPGHSWAIATTVPDDAPPLFALAATDDQLGLAPDSIALYSAWAGAGRSAELHLYAAGGHGFGMRTQGLPSDHWIELFDTWLDGIGMTARVAGNLLS